MKRIFAIIKLLKKMMNYLQPGPSLHSKPITPVIIPRSEHVLSRSMINKNALKVLYRLHDAGFSAYLVGGCVRDLLVGFKPKDFDIATDALPDEVRRLFKNCRLIGKRFRLAHILFGPDIIEVATFRTHHENAHEQHGKSHEGMIVRDNVYGTIEDDAFRRDFRINALYYNIADFSLVDYTGGMQDLHSKVLHMIGDPEKRFLEDPVRLIRAVRFLAKLNFNMSPETAAPLMRLSHLLQNVSSGRLYQEVLKIFHGGAALASVQLLQKYGLFAPLFPLTAESIAHHPEAKQLLDDALANTDQRVNEGKSVSPAFLFAAMIWWPLQNEIAHTKDQPLPEYVKFENALTSVMKQLAQHLAVPRVLQMSIREICLLQHRFRSTKGKLPLRLLEHSRFRAAYDLLLIRAKVGEPVQELATWWTEFMNAHPEQRESLLKGKNKKFSTRRRRKPKAKSEQTAHGKTID